MFLCGRGQHPAVLVLYIGILFFPPTWKIVYCLRNYLVNGNKNALKLNQVIRRF